LAQRVAVQLKLGRKMSHALNDSHAAAIAVAFNHTRTPEYVDQDHPELTLVLRISGGISGATIVIEPPEDDESGFADSILLGGVDSHAGELGHTTIAPGLIDEISAVTTGGLKPPTPGWCSCTHPSHLEPPHHLEAFAGRLALAGRIDATAPDPESVIQDVLREPEAEIHRRALEDIGTMTGVTLRGAVAMLNPAKIVITGALALDPVKNAMDKSLEEEHRVNAHPHVLTLEDDKDFIAAKGAALAVIRKRVYREFDSLLGSPVKKIPERLTAGSDVEDISALPWERKSRE
jgi:hypothetical protein